MTNDDLEAAVFEYLEHRELDPSLSPEAFVSSRADLGRRALATIHAALELERTFPSESQPIRRIGPYQVRDEIGRGGMGIVYHAERDGRSFALKLLPLAPVIGPRVLERFRREAETLAHLSHPCIVRVHDAGMHEEVPYLVMDLIDGQPLHQLIASMTVTEAVRLTEILAETIAVAHRGGVLHRDLKPQNVMVRPDGSPVLLDFGLSVAEEFPTLTATGETLGTPRYMAPEQVLGNTMDVRTDIHALGLILYELVTKRPAHVEASRDALLDGVRFGRIPRPRRINRTLSRELERVILTAVALNPERRYPDAGSLAEDLGRIRRGEPVIARPPGLVTRVVETIRAYPVRSRGLAVGALGEGIVSSRQRAASEPTPAAREQASQHIDRAITLWVDGDSSGSRAEIERARRLDAHDPTRRILDAHLSKDQEPIDETPCLRAAAEAMRLHDAGALAEAAARVESCVGELRVSFVSAVVGLGAAARGELRVALDELTSAARLLPESVRIQRALARVCLQLDRLDDGANAYRRAIDLSPGSAETWADLAEVHLRQRDLDEGLRAILTAESLTTTESTRFLRIRATLEIHSGRQVEARRLLARLLEIDPDDVGARFEWAYSLDTDHDILAAEQGYRGVLESDPRHTGALIGLAHLHSGASRGQCRGCDEAFAAHPECFDLQKAEQYLLRGLEEDRGQSEAVTHNIRDIALRLEHRGAVVDLLERLTAGSSHASAVLRLKDALRRLRLAGG